MNILSYQAEMKHKIDMIIQTAEYEEEKSCKLTEDLRKFLKLDHLEISLKQLKKHLKNIQDVNDEMNVLIKERVEFMLTFTNINIEQYDDVNSKLDEYINALSINDKSYQISYKRDVDEIFVVTYNPEWITSWNANMDFQLCLHSRIKSAVLGLFSDIGRKLC